jgi:hypothetical protein
MTKSHLTSQNHAAQNRTRGGNGMGGVGRKTLYFAGRAYNEMSLKEIPERERTHANRVAIPHNPYINAGAIMCTSLVRWVRSLNMAHSLHMTHSLHMALALHSSHAHTFSLQMLFSVGLGKGLVPNTSPYFVDCLQITTGMHMLCSWWHVMVCVHQQGVVKGPLIGGVKGAIERCFVRAALHVFDQYLTLPFWSVFGLRRNKQAGAASR